MVKNKKGWLLVVEVVIAILIIFGFLFMTITKETKTSNFNFNSDLDYIVDLSMNDQTTKSDLLNGRIGNAQPFLQSKINVILDLEIQECGTCSVPARAVDKEVSSATFFLTNGTNYKKFIAYVWVK